MPPALFRYMCSSVTHQSRPSNSRVQVTVLKSFIPSAALSWSDDPNTQNSPSFCLKRELMATQSVFTRPVFLAADRCFLTNESNINPLGFFRDVGQDWGFSLTVLIFVVQERMQVLLPINVLFIVAVVSHTRNKTRAA